MFAVEIWTRLSGNRELQKIHERQWASATLSAMQAPLYQAPCGNPSTSHIHRNKKLSCLRTCAAATNPRQASGGCEAVKAALREHAVLPAVAALAARHAVRLGDACTGSAARCAHLITGFKGAWAYRAPWRRLHKQRCAAPACVPRF